MIKVSAAGIETNKGESGEHAVLGVFNSQQISIEPYCRSFTR
jgi:hypothetical protein